MIDLYKFENTKKTLILFIVLEICHYLMDLIFLEFMGNSLMFICHFHQESTFVDVNLHAIFL